MSYISLNPFDRIVSLHAVTRKFNFRISYFAFATFFFLVLIGGFIYVYVNLRKSFKASDHNVNEVVSKKKQAFLRKVTFSLSLSPFPLSTLTLLLVPVLLLTQRPHSPTSFSCELLTSLLRSL